MIDVYVKPRIYQQLTSNEKSTSTTHAQVYTSVKMLDPRDTFYKMKISEDALKEARIRETIYWDDCDIEKLKSQGLTFELFQIGHCVGSYNLMFKGSTPPPKLTVSYMLPRVGRTGVDHEACLLYALHNEKGEEINSSDGKLASGLYLAYNRSTDSYSIGEIIDDTPLCKDVLADYDDPVITKDQLPIALEYFVNILKSKSKDAGY